MDTERDDRAQQGAAAVAASVALQERLWIVLNDPSASNARMPHCTAHGLGTVFVQVLVALATTDPNDVTFCLWLIDQVQEQFIKRTGTPPPPSARPH